MATIAHRVRTEPRVYPALFVSLNVSKQKRVASDVTKVLNVVSRYAQLFTTNRVPSDFAAGDAPRHRGAPRIAGGPGAQRHRRSRCNGGAHQRGTRLPRYHQTAGHSAQDALKTNSELRSAPNAAKTIRNIAATPMPVGTCPAPPTDQLSPAADEPPTTVDQPSPAAGEPVIPAGHPSNPALVMSASTDAA